MREEQLKKGIQSQMPDQLPKDILELRGSSTYTFTDSEED